MLQLIKVVIQNIVVRSTRFFNKQNIVNSYRLKLYAPRETFPELKLRPQGLNFFNRKMSRDVLGDNAAEISIKQLGIHNSLPSHPLRVAVFTLLSESLVADIKNSNSIDVVIVL